MQRTTVGIDIAKHVLQLHGVDSQGKGRLPTRVSRATRLACMRQFPPCRVGGEACGGAHDWARALTRRGHEGTMLAPQQVKPYVHGHKTDRGDAQAICEATSRPSVKAVPVRSVRNPNVAGVALANKNARMLWAMLAKGTTYQAA